MNKDILVIYHDNCLDGFGAAYAAWKRLGDIADYLPWSYDRPARELPSLVGKSIYILDFSFKPADIAWMLSLEAANITIIDHHKTFINAVENDEYCDADKVPWPRLNIHYDVNKSGAILAWEFFHDTEPSMPLKYIQDRDLWKFELKGTKEICAALANKYVVSRSFDVWDDLANAFDIDDTEVTDMLYAQSWALVAAQRQLVDECMATASEPFIDPFGFKMVLCNAPASVASELGNALATKYPDCIAVIWHTDEKTGIHKHSLRSVGDVDCTELAKKFGGGGHKNAAGFSVNINEDREDEMG